MKIASLTATTVTFDIEPHEREELASILGKKHVAHTELVILTPDEAAELRDGLTQAIDKIAPKTRTPDDVHDRPQPGDELRWSDGEVWRVIESDGHRVRFLMTGDQRRGESSLQLRAWAMRNDPACAHTFVCIPASNVPPPAA